MFGTSEQCDDTRFCRGWFGQCAHEDQVLVVAGSGIERQFRPKEEVGGEDENSGWIHDGRRVMDRSNSRDFILKESTAAIKWQHLKNQFQKVSFRRALSPENTIKVKKYRQKIWFWRVKRLVRGRLSLKKRPIAIGRYTAATHHHYRCKTSFICGISGHPHWGFEAASSSKRNSLFFVPFATLPRFVSSARLDSHWDVR